MTERPPPFRRFVGRRPHLGAAAAARTVAEDVSELLRAEIALAKAETTQAVKAKLLGAGFFIAAALMCWFLLQSLLVLIGIAVGQAFRNPFLGALTVFLLLVIVVALLGFLGYRKLQTRLSLEQTKVNLERDRTVVAGALDRAKVTANEEVELARTNWQETAVELADRAAELQRRVSSDGAGPGRSAGR